MANLDPAYAITLGIEGGYVLIPGDKGLETYKGISRANFPAWQGWAIIDSYKSKPNFPKILDTDSSIQSLIKQFYKVNFWDKAMLDHVTSQELANEIFDTGVNQGMTTAVKYVQEALNLLNKNHTLYNDIAMDGIMGNGTLGFLNAYKNTTAMLRTLNGLQFMKYVKICEADPSQEIFFNGWLTRT